MRKTLLFGLLILALLLTKPLQFLAPLDKDSGALAYISWRMTRGDLIYADLFDHKTPGMYYLMSFIFRVFGTNLVFWQTFALLWNLLTLFFFFKLIRNFFDDDLSLLLTSFLAFFGNVFELARGGSVAESFILLLAILAFKSVHDFQKRGRGEWPFLIFSGMLVGTATFLKQTGVGLFFAIVGFLLYCKRTNFFKQIGAIFLGFLVFWSGPLFYFFRKGILADFFDQVVSYNMVYLRFSLLRFFYRPWSGFLNIFDETAVLWVLGTAGFFWAMRKLRKEERKDFLMVIFWFGGGFLGLVAGWKFFPHYFLPVIPPLILICGWWIKGWKEGRGDQAGGVFVNAALAVLVLVSVFTQIEAGKKLFSEEPWIGPVRRVKKAVSFLDRQTSEKDYIYIWGSEGAVLFQAKRVSPGRFFFGYPLAMESYRIKAISEMTRDLKKNPPQFIFDASIDCELPRLNNLKDPYWEEFLDWFEENYEEITPIESWLVYRRSL